MKIVELLKKVEIFTSEPIVKFTINKELFNNPDGRKLYNKKIRDKVLDKFGVYLWTDSKTDIIYYIGMAGKLNTDGIIGNHTLKNRLQAPRTLDKETKKYIQTNDYIKKFMFEKKIESLDFYILYSKDDIPPAHLESVLLYEFFKQKKCLPRLNNSF